MTNLSALIIEDHPLFASGVRDLIKLIAPGVKVVHTTSLAQAKSAFTACSPAIIVSDLHLPGSDKLDVIQWLEGEAANIPVVLMTGDLEFVNAQQRLNKPHSWIIPKQIAFEKASKIIVEAFESVGLVARWSQESSFQSVTERLVERVGQSNLKRKELTEKQVQVMELVAVGLTNKEIARHMSISPETIKHHMKDIFERLNATSRTQAVAIFRQMSMVDSVDIAA